MSVGPTRGPVTRPSNERDFTELFGRVEDIERTKTGGGIQFHEGTYGADNEGDWLDVTTTSADPDGWGINLHAGDGFHLEATPGDGAFGNIAMEATDAFDITVGGSLNADVTTDVTIAAREGDMSLTAGVNVVVAAENGDLDISAVGITTITSDSETRIATTTGNVLIRPDDTIEMEPLGGGVIVTLQIGASMLVTDHLSAPIFRVDEDATVHIKTGQTITADL